MQVLGDVPPELRVTPERDIRLAEQATALSDTDAVRLLDLVSAALEATANGAQARIQLELVLVKAAAPEVDPSMAALLARIERLERAPAAPRRRCAGVSVPRRAAPTAPTAPEPGSDRERMRSRLRPSRRRRRRSRSRRRNPRRRRRSISTTAAASWPAVVDLVRGENAMLAALLSDARPVAVKERELTLAFPGGAAFLKRKAEQDDYRRVAGEALQAVTGQRLALRYELRDDEERAGGRAGRSPARSWCDASWRSSTPKRCSKTITNEGEVKG